MDTKTLYDWANEARLSFKDEDGYHDAASAWLDAVMKSPGDLMDYWLDALSELHGEEQKDALTELLTEIGTLHGYITNLGTNARNTESCGGFGFAYVNATALRSSLVGEGVYTAIHKFMKTHIEKNAQEWWGDVCSYDYDMRVEGRADYEYERMKDRKLEERYEG